jgi:hypothetical protein
MDLPLGGGRRSQINQAADGLQPCNLATLPPPSPTPAKEKPPLRLCRLLDWSLGPASPKPPAQARLAQPAGRSAPSLAATGEALGRLPGPRYRAGIVAMVKAALS